MAIRECIKQQRLNLSKEQRQQAAIAVGRSVLSLCCYQQAKHLAFYLPVNAELDLSYVWQLAIAANKYCYFPKLHQKHLLFLPYTSGEAWRKNRYGIDEPNPLLPLAIDPSQLDIVFTPLLAFDKTLNRLGMGGGYYDRTFAFRQQPAKLKPKLIGVAYEMQRVAALRRNLWDVPLDAVISEQSIYGDIK